MSLVSGSSSSSTVLRQMSRLGQEAERSKLRIQAMMVAKTQQLEAASAADAFSEANSLQTEVDEISGEAGDLARAHRFTDADLGDSLAAVSVSHPGSKQPQAAAENGDGSPPVPSTEHTQRCGCL